MSLDAVVATLDGERAINTVEKTSRDWDDFKIREGIDDDLAQKTKDGYAAVQLHSRGCYNAFLLFAVSCVPFASLDLVVWSLISRVQLLGAPGFLAARG